MALELVLRGLEGQLRLRGCRRGAVVLPDGTQLSYLEKGPPTAEHTLVLVHGLGTSNLSWARVLLRLGGRHRVLAPDLPGFGRSQIVAGHEFATIPQLAQAVVAFLESDACAGPVALVGQSMGGWVSVKAARSASDRVEQLVLVNTAGVLYPGIEDLGTAVRPTTKDEVYAFWKRMWFRVPTYLRPFWRVASAHMRTRHVGHLIETLRPEDFINDDLMHLTMPVSIVWGRADRLIPIDHVDLLRERLGSTRIYWLAKCGHIPALEQPREFARVLDGIVRAPPEARPEPPRSAHAAAAGRPPAAPSTGARP